MNESELKEIIKNCKTEMKPDGFKTQDLQLPQLSWVLFLKVFDYYEQEREVLEKHFEPAIPKPYRWSDWAGVGDKGINGEKLIKFVNGELFPALKNLTSKKGPNSRLVISSAFNEFKNRMTDGFALRKIVNYVDRIKFDNSEVLKDFAKAYQSELTEWVNEAENNAYFFTPRPIAEFIVSQVNPSFKKKERVFDPACGLGGFLIEAFDYMKKDEKEKSDIQKLRFDSLIGQEKNPEFYLCGVLNMMLQGINIPHVLNVNTLSRPTKEIPPEGEYEVIITNPSYNEPENEDISDNLPYELKTKDTALHFLFFIMEELKNKGRAAIILPNGPLFAGGVAAKIKQRLLEKFNLHMIVRLPESIFAPRTGIATNILFFEKGTPTNEIWYYEMKVPQRLFDPSRPTKKLSYGKQQPVLFEDFNDLLKWCENKKKNENAWKVSVSKIKDYNLDIKNPHVEEKEVDLSPHELIKQILVDERKTLELLEDVEKLIQKEIPK